MDRQILPYIEPKCLHGKKKCTTTSSFHLVGMMLKLPSMESANMIIAAQQNVVIYSKTFFKRHRC